MFMHNSGIMHTLARSECYSLALTWLYSSCTFTHAPSCPLTTWKSLLNPTDTPCQWVLHKAALACSLGRLPFLLEQPYHVLCFASINLRPAFTRSSATLPSTSRTKAMFPICTTTASTSKSGEPHWFGRQAKFVATRGTQDWIQSPAASTHLDELSPTRTSTQSHRSCPVASKPIHLCCVPKLESPSPSSMRFPWSHRCSGQHLPCTESLAVITGKYPGCSALPGACPSIHFKSVWSARTRKEQAEPLGPWAMTECPASHLFFFRPTYPLFIYFCFSGRSSNIYFSLI